jgi:multidrug efflux pump subunit AcrA (membrane-fusion protein)
MNKRKEVFKGVGSLALLLLMMAWLSGAFVSKVKPGEAKITEPAAKPQETVPVREVAYPFEAEQVGTIRTKADTWVSSRIMAQVKEILVSEGASVRGIETGAPTVLARLDDRDLRAKVQQAESNLQAAKRAVEMAKAQLEAAKANLSSAKAQKERVSADYRRYQELYKQGAATAQQLEHMRAQFITAESQYSGAFNQVQSAQADLSRMEAQVSRRKPVLPKREPCLIMPLFELPSAAKLLKRWSRWAQWFPLDSPFFTSKVLLSQNFMPGWRNLFFLLFLWEVAST